VVDVVVLAFFLPVPFTRKTMSTIKAARIAKLMPRRCSAPLLAFSMMACFCSRAARWRALFSLARSDTLPKPRGGRVTRRRWCCGGAGTARPAGPPRPAGPRQQ